MTKSKKEAHAAPRLRQAVETIMWPRAGTPIVRCRAGAILDAEDPLLNTELIDPELRAELGVEVSDQTWKTVAAPDGAKVTPHHSKQAQLVYSRLGFDRVPYVVGNDEAEAPPTGQDRIMPRQPIRRRAAATVPPIDGEE